MQLGSQMRSLGLMLALMLAGGAPVLTGAEPRRPEPLPTQVTQVLAIEGQAEVLLTGTTNWQPARVGQPLGLGDRLRTGRMTRATVRFADLSRIRVNELTTLEFLPAGPSDRRPLLDLKGGSVYFFSREKPADVRFRTPLAAGAIRGTEFHLAVLEGDETRVAVLEGKVEVTNDLGAVTLESLEEALVRPGGAPAKSALVEALNVIQWCLYYPAVVDPEDLGLTILEREHYAVSLAAYYRGDLLAALAALPPDTARPSETAVVYLAALRLAVGQVAQATNLLASAPTAPASTALREMIAATQNRPWPATPPATASEWLARSYHLQSRGQLEAALRAAQSAVEKSPAFGFAWVRLAELQFGFGHVKEATKALERGLELAPRNAQAVALEGYLLAARGRFLDAKSRFERALELDGALGNAWLGQGLCRIWLGDAEGGRHDLQTAATLEPQRAIFRSYLGKAFSHAAQDRLAEKELGLAKKLDPRDPTAWLYAALLAQRQNRLHEALADLEQARALNDHRGLFRSRLLLDQDHAVRSANQATVYRDLGMEETARREAARAVVYDYASYSAHLFLAQSYETLRDPKKFNLRYDAARESELLLARLLAPVGGGLLSRHITLQDYAGFFDTQRMGLSGAGEYRSGGDWLYYGSVYGRLGDTGYALDSYYHAENGQRPNNDLEQIEVTAQLKERLTAADSLYFQAGYYDDQRGDVLQYYDQAQGNPTARATYKQQPDFFAGYHREWSPESHTLLLLGGLEETLTQAAPNIERPYFKFSRPGPTPSSILARGFDMVYRRKVESYSAEAQQIWQAQRQALVLGAFYQGGWADVTSKLTQVIPGNLPPPPPIAQQVETDLQRASLYAYYQLQLWEPLRLILGASGEWLKYPNNADLPPVSSDESQKDRLSPKLGLLYTPGERFALRALYTQSLGGAFHENSYRLEPAQLAGFTQAFRSLIPESAVGIVPGTVFETVGVGMDKSFKSGTYLGLEAEWLSSEAERELGAVTHAPGRPFSEPTRAMSARQRLDFEEKTVAFDAHQLIGRQWAVGARYRLSQAELVGTFGLPAGVPNSSSLKLEQNEVATLQQLSGFVGWNLPAGFFSEFLVQWTTQSNRGYALDLPGDDFWHYHFYLGYRFPRRAAEVRLGILNLTDRDYRLNPLNYYLELPRERTFAVSFKLRF